MTKKEFSQIVLVTPTPNRNVLGQILDWWSNFTKDPDDFVSYNGPNNKKAKEIFIRLWHAFPGVTFSEEIITDSLKQSGIIEEFVNEKYLSRFSTYYPQEKKTKYQYSIGPNGIQLVQMWHAEKLTWISLLFSIVAGITALVSLVVTAAQSSQNFAAVIVTYQLIFLFIVIVALYLLARIKKWI